MTSATPRIPEWLRLTVLVAAIALVSYALLMLLFDQRPVSVADSGPQVQASDWHLKTLDGVDASFDDYTGQVTLLALWATWCGPCMQEMPHIQRVHEQLASEGLRVVAIAVSDEMESVQKTARDKQWTFDIAVEHRGQRPAELDVRGIPTTFILSPSGEVLAKHSGFYAWDSDVAVTSLREVLARYPGAS